MTNLQNKKEKLLKQLSEIEAKVRKQKRRKRVTCPQCNKSMAIGSVVFFEHKFYDYDGGYDKQEFTCDSDSHFRCKHCNTAVRILPKEILNLRRLFKEVKRHTGQINPPWINYGGDFGVKR